MEVKCPYCGSEDTYEIDSLDIEVNPKESYEHSLYACKKCEESFYVWTTLEITKIEISKEKYNNFETIYEK